MRSSTKPGPYGWAVRRVLHSPLRLQTRPGLLIAAALVSGAQLFRVPAAAFATDRNRDNRARLRAVVSCRVFFQRVSMRIPQPFLAAKRFALPSGGV